MSAVFALKAVIANSSRLVLFPGKEKMKHHTFEERKQKHISKKMVKNLYRLAGKKVNFCHRLVIFNLLMFKTLFNYKDKKRILLHQVL